MKYLEYYLLFFIFLIVASCSYPVAYRQELVEADNMLMRGQYSRSDSILAIFDHSSDNKNHSDQMYRNLLGLVRQFTTSQLTSHDFLMADSLVRYYKTNQTRESAMAKLILAEVYRNEGEYPSAISTLLLSKQELSSTDEPTLQIWINRKIGDIYFEQRMLPECISYYQNSFDMASKQHDLYRMSIGAYSMARVYIIKNNADSAIYYLKKSIEWSKYHPEGMLAAIPAKSVLADIYTQIGEYNKAATLLTRNSIDDENWAFWHMGQQHTDSAAYYFKKMVGRGNWKGDITYLSILAKMEENQGHRDKALEYYKQLCSAKDSLKAHSQIEETHKSMVRHEYKILKERRDAAERQNTFLLYSLTVVFLAVIIATAIVAIAWHSYKVRKESELLQKKLQLKEEERRNKQSTSQLHANEQKIAQLEAQLQEARITGKISTTDRLRMEAALLTTENANIRAKIERDKLVLYQLRHSALYVRIKEHASQEGFRLTKDEWQEIARQIDDTFDDFTARLRTLYDNISQDELRICYLVKLGVQSTDIGNMLCKSKAAISMARQRLYKKLTGSKGTARQLNEIIENF